MNDREITRIGADGLIREGESADLIAMSQGDSGIDANDEEDEFEDDGDLASEDEPDLDDDENEMSPEDPNAYPLEFDGSGDGDETSDNDDDDEDDDDTLK